MNKLELLKEEYIKIMKRFDDINMKIAEAVDENKEYKRYPRFHDKEDTTYVYSLHDYDYYESQDDKDMELLNISDEEYDKSIEEAVQLRNSLFEEKYKLQLEYDEWCYKNSEELKKIEYGERRDWYKPYTIKWRGWDSSDYVYDTMIYSINLTNKDEVNKLISNMRKIVDIIITFEEDHEIKWGFDYETVEFIDYLEIVNNQTRFRKNEYCMTTMALDIMENHYVYEPFEESFKACIRNVCNQVDGEFKRFIHRLQEWE